MRLIYDVGYDDYKHQVGIVKSKCPYYSRWRDLIRRCYDPKCLIKVDNYKDCTICDEWLTFSLFKKWMEKQNWKGKQLDKDLLIKGNTYYSPDTCCFIERRINTFICGANRKDNKSGYTGVVLQKDCGMYRASCKNPFTGDRGYIGIYKSPNEAYLQYLLTKQAYVKQLICETPDMEERIKNALLCRYTLKTIVCE